MCVCILWTSCSAAKNALLIYMTVCEKVLPRLDKYDDVIEWNFMKIAPPEMKSWLRHWRNPLQIWIATYNYGSKFEHSWFYRWINNFEQCCVASVWSSKNLFRIHTLISVQIHHISHAPKITSKVAYEVSRNLPKTSPQGYLLCFTTFYRQIFLNT